MSDETPAAVEPAPDTDKKEKARGGMDARQWIAVGIGAAAMVAIVVIYRQTCERSLAQQREANERLEAVAVEEYRKRQAAEHAASENGTAPQKPLPVRPVVVAEPVVAEADTAS